MPKRKKQSASARSRKAKELMRTMRSQISIVQDSPFQRTTEDLLSPMPGQHKDPDDLDNVNMDSAKDAHDCSETDDTARQVARLPVAEEVTATPGCSKWAHDTKEWQHKGRCDTDNTKDSRQNTRAVKDKERYRRDEVFREKKKQLGKKKYAEDSKYRGQLIERGKRKYLEDAEYRGQLIERGKRK